MKFKSFCAPTLILGLSVNFSLVPVDFAHAANDSTPGLEDDADFDRLDGTGISGKKVHVIEWEGNLEIHVYPAGSLKGLALKLDKRNKDKPVMVIGYRFEDNPSQQLIRRAILGVPFHEGFKAYRDTSADDYDKIVISNHGLPLAQFKLDAEPSQLYPDGHPALADQNDKKESPKRIPAAKSKSNAEGSENRRDSQVDENGTIKPFSW